MGIENMGASSSSTHIDQPAERPPVPTGVTRIHIAGAFVMDGWGMGSPNVGKAHRLASLIAESQPSKYQTWQYLSNSGYKAFLRPLLLEFDEAERAKQSTNDKGTTVAQHHSTPFVWLESTDAEGKKVMTALGGRDKFVEWASREFADVPAIAAAATSGFSFSQDAFFNTASTPSKEAVMQAKAQEGRSCMGTSCNATAKTAAA